MFKDILIYVGRSFYNKSQFLAEASTLGVCRRVPRVPDVTIGKSRCFLVIKDLYKGKEQNVIFAYFIIKSIGYVVSKKTDLPEELRKRGIKPIEVSGGSVLPVRGCGQLVFGATYILSEEDFAKTKDLAEKTDIRGNIILIDPPIPYKGRWFRGFKYVDGNKLLRGKRSVQVSRKLGRWGTMYKTLGGPAFRKRKRPRKRRRKDRFRQTRF